MYSRWENLEMGLMCTVIIPVGPGHHELAQAALQSVMFAAYDKGDFDKIHVIMGDDTGGKIGRSAARNRMALGPAEDWMMGFTTGDDEKEAFSSEWLFFLDADDLMCCERSYGESAFKVASPFLEEYDCIWGAIYDLRGRDVEKRKQVGRITTYKAYVSAPAVLGCNFSHFVRRDKFLELGGFNEDMDVAEDVEWTIKAWKNLHCIKQEKPLYLHRKGQHSWMQKLPEGARPTFNGRDWSIRAEELLKEARKELA